MKTWIKYAMPIWLHRVKKAFKGQLRYDYGVLGIIIHEGRPVNAVEAKSSSVFALSYPQALAEVSARFPEYPICSLYLFEESVCIKFLIAYPCRLARWIFSYQEMSRIERNAVFEVLCIQTRKAVLKETDHGRFIHVMIPPDAPECPPLPLYPTEGTVGCWDSVCRNRH